MDYREGESPPLSPEILAGFRAALEAQERHGLKGGTPNVDWPVIGLHDERMEDEA